MNKAIKGNSKTPVLIWGIKYLIAHYLFNTLYSTTTFIITLDKTEIRVYENINML